MMFCLVLSSIAEPVWSGLFIKEGQIVFDRSISSLHSPLSRSASQPARPKGSLAFAYFDSLSSKQANKKRRNLDFE